MRIISYGADPEFFLEDNKGSIVSALDVGVPPKEKAIELNTCKIFADNVAVEFNINPQVSRTGFIATIENSTKELERFIQKEFGLKLSDKIDHEFADTQLKKPGAMEFSCREDFSALTFSSCQRIDPALVGGLRTVGGHLHLGLSQATGDHIGHDRRYYFVRFLDMYAGLYSASIEPPNSRRTLYGQASKFRFTGYGLEYRTPSNFWLPKNSKRNLTSDLLWHVDQALAKTNQMLEDPDARVPDQYFSVINSIDSDNKKRIKELYSNYIEDAFLSGQYPNAC
jgi:hypothetical protein